MAEDNINTEIAGITKLTDEDSNPFWESDILTALESRNLVGIVDDTEETLEEDKQKKLKE